MIFDSLLHASKYLAGVPKLLLGKSGSLDPEDVLPALRDQRMTGYLIRLGNYAQARKGFPNDSALGQVLSVDKEQLLRWKEGAVPRPEEERLLRDLAVVVSELQSVYEAEAIPAWLNSRSPGETKTPLELLREGSLAEVLHLINASTHAAYS